MGGAAGALSKEPEPERRPRVLIIEDDEGIRSALEIALKGEGYEVDAHDRADRVYELATRFRPDLALLDVRLPGQHDGYEIARKLRGWSDIPVIFLTAADTIKDRLAGFDAGGDDYVVKPFSMAEVLARVRALLRRAGRAASGSRQVGDLVLDDSARVATRCGVQLDLTRIEYDLLSVMAGHPGRVFSKLELLSHVWGFEGYSPNLVEVHVSELRRKLEVHGPRLVHTLRGSGYVLRA